MRIMSAGVISDVFETDCDKPPTNDGRYALAEKLLARREKALRAGSHAAAERLLALAWEAYDRAQSAGGRTVSYLD